MLTNINPPIATLSINYDQTKLVRGIKNLSFANVTLQTDATGNVLGCSLAQTPSGSIS